MQQLIASSQEMEDLGASLVKNLRAPAIVYLRGELGTGKTTLVRGALRALGHHGLVKSPTFTIVESYSLAQLDIHHFDLYRISDPEELDFIGIREYFSDSSICFFEWPDQGGSVIPAPTIEIQISHAGDQRKVKIATHVDKLNKNFKI